MKRYTTAEIRSCELVSKEWVSYSETITQIKALGNLIRDMLFDIPVIPDRYKYVKRLKEIKEIDNEKI